MKETTRRIQLLLLLALVSACGADRPAPKPEPVRLLELARGVEVEWGAAERKRPEEAAPALGRKVPGGLLGRVTMSETGGRSAETRWFFDERAAFLAPSGTRYRFPVTLPQEPVLQLGLGYLSPPEGAAPRSVRFEVEVAGETILDETVEARPEGRWRDRELDLGPWAGRDVTVELRTSGEGPPVWAAWSAPEILSAAGREEGWDVVLVSLDTLRADHLGCYGHLRPTSPHLDALADGGVRFATAVAQSPWTKPSHRSLLTGLYPVAHKGLRSPPLAAVLWRAGYRTWAVTGGGQVHPRFEFGRGFETYRVEDWIRAVDGVAERFSRGRGRKQFLFLHTYEVHDPYFHTTFADGLPRGRVGERFAKADKDPQRIQPPTAEERAYVEALYDSGIAFVDEALGRLFAEFEKRGVLERAIVVVTSDHGEELWEHGKWGHGTTVYDHQLLVPLIVHLPPGLRRELGAAALPPGSVVARQVRLVDLYPTLLELLDVPLGHRVQGRSLKDLLAGGTLPEIDAFAENTNVAVEQKALRSSRFKLVYSYHKRRRATTGRTQLYDLRRDPEERHDLLEKHPELAAALMARMEQIIFGSGEAGYDEIKPEGIDPKLREQLEALGYLGN